MCRRLSSDGFGNRSGSAAIRSPRLFGPAVGVEVGELDLDAVDEDTAGDLAAWCPVPVAAFGLGAAVLLDLHRSSRPEVSS
jgi:hypothetical protein